MRDASKVKLPDSLISLGSPAVLAALHLPQRDGAGANLTSIYSSAASLASVSYARACVAMLKKSWTFTSLYNPLIALYGSDIYTPIAQMEVR